MNPNTPVYFSEWKQVTQDTSIATPDQNAFATDTLVCEAVVTTLSPQLYLLIDIRRTGGAPVGSLIGSQLMLTAVFTVGGISKEFIVAGAFAPTITGLGVYAGPYYVTLQAGSNAVNNVAFVLPVNAVLAFPNSINPSGVCRWKIRVRAFTQTTGVISSDLRIGVAQGSVT